MPLIYSDRSRSYGTSLFYYEKMSKIRSSRWHLEINGEFRKDSKGRQLYVPRALCVLSHQPIFSAFNVFLRELYRFAILDSEDRFADENVSIPKVESFEALLRKGENLQSFPCRFDLRYTAGRWHDISPLYDSSSSFILVERYIQHYVDFCPVLDPGYLIHVSIPASCYVAPSLPKVLHDSHATSYQSSLFRQALFRLLVYFSLPEEYR